MLTRCGLISTCWHRFERTYIAKFGPAGDGSGGSVFRFVSRSTYVYAGSFASNGDYWGVNNKKIYKFPQPQQLPEYTFETRTSAPVAGDAGWTFIGNFDENLKTKDITTFKYNLAGASDGSTQEYFAGLSEDRAEAYVLRLDTEQKYRISISGYPTPDKATTLASPRTPPPRTPQLSRPVHW